MKAPIEEDNSIPVFNRTRIPISISYSYDDSPMQLAERETPTTIDSILQNPVSHPLNRIISDWIESEEGTLDESLTASFLLQFLHILERSDVDPEHPMFP